MTVFNFFLFFHLFICFTFFFHLFNLFVYLLVIYIVTQQILNESLPMGKDKQNPFLRPRQVERVTCKHISKVLDIKEKLG